MPPEPMEVSRQAHLDAILQSASRHKIIVAGPGTGKTYTFKQLLIRNPGDNLVMTFINNLVTDMTKDLAGVAEVRTFHSYCRKLLHKLPPEGIRSDFIFFTKLKELVTLDAPILAPHFPDADTPIMSQFDDAFRNLAEDERIAFFLSRGDFYNSVGFDDSVYRVLAYFRRHPEAIPPHNLLILDEYQDFNALEVAFISMLEERSATLIVGDDDQAIYEFRSASPLYLRMKAQDSSYERFPLPYCSRCTEAIILAAHSVIARAQGIGLLAGRIQKDLICYIPEKAADNKTYPAIVAARCSTHSKKAPYIPKYIEHVLRAIPHHEAMASVRDGYPLALIVAPSHYLSQVFQYLSPRVPNVVYTPRPDFDLTIFDAYYCLLADRRSNLAWRLLMEFHAKDMIEDALASTSDGRVDLVDTLSVTLTEPHLSRLERLSDALRAPTAATPEAIAELEVYFQLPFQEILAHFSASLRLDDLNDDHEGADAPAYSEPAPTIRLTTYSGCKGLSAAFTFMAGLEEGVFPHTTGHPTETEICQLVVALTRTRKQCHLITTSMFAGNWQRPSEFFQWLPPRGVQEIEVTKDFFV